MRTHATLSLSFPIFLFVSSAQTFTFRLFCLPCCQVKFPDPKTLHINECLLLLKHGGCLTHLWAVSDAAVPLSCFQLLYFQIRIPPRPLRPALLPSSSLCVLAQAISSCHLPYVNYHTSSWFGPWESDFRCGDGRPFLWLEKSSEWRQLSPLLTWNNCLLLSAVILSLLFSMNAWALLNKNVLQFLGWKGKLSLFCSEWNGVISRGGIKWVGLKLSLKPGTFQGTVIPDPGSRFLLIVLYFCRETFRTCQKRWNAFRFCARSFFLFVFTF